MRIRRAIGLLVLGGAIGCLAGTKVGLIYDAGTGELLRIVIPDNDASLTSHRGLGEGLAVIDKTAYQSMTRAQLAATLEAASGKRPPAAERLAVLDADGFVVKVVHEVQARHREPVGFSVRVSTFAQIGDQFVGDVHTPKYPPPDPSSGTLRGLGAR